MELDQILMDEYEQAYKRKDEPYASAYVEGLKDGLSKNNCSANERAFLDEIREKGRYVKNDELKLECIEISCENGNVFLHQSDFNTPLEGLVNGK